MSKVFRALLISAAATGAAALAVHLLQRRQPVALLEAPRNDTAEVEDERLTDEQRELLKQEMAASF